MKRWLLGIAAVLGLGAGGMTLFPQAAPFAPIVRVAGEQLRSHASQMPDDCEPKTCAYDAKDGRNHVRGPISWPDGGFCVCR